MVFLLLVSNPRLTQLIEIYILVAMAMLFYILKKKVFDFGNLEVCPDTLLELKCSVITKGLPYFTVS